MNAPLHTVDAGTGFGLWPDPTSRLIYHDAMPTLLSGIDLHGRVVDLGGGNGLLKAWIPQAVTVDLDQAKAPDVVADLMTYRGEHDLVVLRYVLHYLSDQQVSTLFNRLAGWHSGRVLVIQFVNDLDMASKRYNSVNETKWFRGEADTRALMHPWRDKSRKRLEYQVDAEFYRQRLGSKAPSSHPEAVVAWELERL